MQSLMQVLSEGEQAQIHERTLEILASTGVRVDTEHGRRFLGQAGAEVDESSCIVRFPRDVVETALRSAPKRFTLGARRPGWDLELNAGGSTLTVDGEATSVHDWESGQHRLPTFSDWQTAVRLIDAIGEIGLYWRMIQIKESSPSSPLADLVRYWRYLFGHFSKHVQDTIPSPAHAPWLLEMLQIVFGDRDEIRRRHPLSYLLCPQSPLVIDSMYTDAYLALLGWDVPVAVMPMPLMGATGPGSLTGTIIVGNCEVLAMLCLLQAAAPGTPVIYAPALATMNLRTGQYRGGAIEQGIMAVAAIQMARFYDLPVIASGIGTDHFVPGIQAGYERALNGMMPALAKPDILVGAGLLGGSMILSLEQLVIDVEVYKMFGRAQEGVVTDDNWLDDVIDDVGPAGNFLAERSTRDAIRAGEWYISSFGMHDSMEAWIEAGKPSLMGEAHRRVVDLVAGHEALPFDEEVERELNRLERRATEALLP